MNKLTDIKNCHVCGGTTLIPKVNIPIIDIFTDEEIYRTVLECHDCETLHYIREGKIEYEFSCKIDNLITDKELKEWE